MIASLTPWLDAGGVGSLTLPRLERHLGAHDLGSLVTPGTYFDFTRYRPTVFYTEGERQLTIPNASLRYGRGEQGFDFIFLHMLEPHTFAEEYIDSIVEVMAHFKVRRLCRIGAMYDAVPHTRPLLVTGSLDGEPLTGVEGVTASRRPTYEGPTSIMNMVGDRLRELDVETMMLMVRLPQYVQIEEDYSGVARLLNVLCSLYDFPPETEVSQRGERQYERVSREIKERNPGVGALVERLEQDYDARMDSPSEEPIPPLPPSVEEFLGELDDQENDS